MTFVYAFNVLLSAFLLFQIQPMIAKFMLPWFGGTPVVWSTVLVFSQSLLTGGYAYAYWSFGRLRARLQAVVHIGLLGLSLALLLSAAIRWPSPLTPDATWRPMGGDLPIWGILKILLVTIGMPYFLLSSNSTLAQAWFSRENTRRTPYRLYSLSNAGSLLALVSYPFLIEPYLTLRAQAFVWSLAYVLFAALSAYLSWRMRRQVLRTPEEKYPLPHTEKDKSPSLGRLALWGGLAACATTLLVAATNQITQEVAVIPLLWVLPLTVYLLTFILAFSGGYLYFRSMYLAGLVLASFASIWMMANWASYSIVAQIVALTLLLFFVCMICHNELYRLRPPAGALPVFYCMVAAGGALGGIFATVLAPMIFLTGFWELHWSLVACGVLFMIAMLAESAADHRSMPRTPTRRTAAKRRSGIKPLVVVTAAFVLLLGAFTLYTMRALSGHRLAAARNFYGVLRVWEINGNSPAMRAHMLSHGRTSHGFQFVAPERRALATTYYTESSGVGLAIANHPARPKGLRIGIMGLGVGVLASYGRPQDTLRFYEINQDVTRFAEGEGGYFSFLKDSRANIEIVTGDARLELERELADGKAQNFDVLVLDAFCSDAVPQHLLTTEAFRIYMQHLAPDGVIAINISSRYFKLEYPVYAVAKAHGLAAERFLDEGAGGRSYDSIWILLARPGGFLEIPAIMKRSARPPDIPQGFRAWTDDFSNIVQILK